MILLNNSENKSFTFIWTFCLIKVRRNTIIFVWWFCQIKARSQITLFDNFDECKWEKAQ